MSTSSIPKSPQITRSSIDLPRKLQPLFRPKRYKVLWGGRGAIKSWSIARALLYIASKNKELILCARETQASIGDSVHRLLKEQIDKLGLSAIYKIHNTSIECPRQGSEFIFAGIRNDPNKIKSMEGVTRCWVSEAAKVSEESWRILKNTIRREGSEIWIDFNPDLETDPTAKRFLLNPPPDCVLIELNWRDNPWLPETLRKEKDYDYRTDPEAAANTWGGQFRKASAAQIFAGKYVVEDFTPFVKAPDGKTDVLKPSWTGPYFGADWGFASDPTTLIKCWRDETKLYIEEESYGVGVALNEIPALWNKIPGANEHTIRADNSRPETIFHVSQFGFNVVAAEKWPGSVEDGIAWLRAHEQIVIHPRCKRTEEEFRLYSFKTDPVTGDILPIIIDKHQHLIDSLRYAMGPAIRVPEEEYTVFYEEEPISINPELDEFELKNPLY